MDPESGVFTAPVSGIYSFSLSAVQAFSSSGEVSQFGGIQVLRDGRVEFRIIDVNQYDIIHEDYQGLLKLFMDDVSGSK